MLRVTARGHHSFLDQRRKPAGWFLDDKRIRSQHSHTIFQWFQHHKTRFYHLSKRMVICSHPLSVAVSGDATPRNLRRCARQAKLTTFYWSHSSRGTSHAGLPIAAMSVPRLIRTNLDSQSNGNPTGRSWLPRSRTKGLRAPIDWMYYYTSR